MELAQITTATLAADMIMSSTPAAANSPPVYNSTTVPLNDPQQSKQQQQQNGSGNGNGNGRSRQDEKYQLNMFSNLPERTPVDIQFKDISYCVSAGFRKGERGRIKSYKIHGKLILFDVLL